MAERTSIPELDACLTAFELSNPELEEPVDETDETIDWSDLFSGTLSELREEPSLAAGLCTQLACELSEFAQAAGFDAVSTEQPDPRSPLQGRGAHTPELFGYADRVCESGYPFHAAVLFYFGEQVFLVDYAAGQFGYREFPLVQRFDSAQFERDWDV